MFKAWGQFPVPKNKRKKSVNIGAGILFTTPRVGDWLEGRGYLSSRTRD
jgi:hypothetical protein